MKLRYLHDKDPWMLAEDIPDMDFAFAQIWLSGFVNEFARPTGRAYKKILAIYRGYHLWFYYGERDAYEVGQHIVQKFVRKPAFAARVNREIVRWSDKLRAYATRLPKANLDRLSNQRLWQLHEGHDRMHAKYYQWGWIPVGADMFHANLTERLKSYLQSIGVREEKLNEYFVILTQPTKKSLIQIERDEFLRIIMVAKRSKGKLTPRVLTLLQQHYKKYFYVNRMWVGKVSTFEYYRDELLKLVRSKIDPKKLLRKEHAAFQSAVRERSMLLRQLKIKGKWRVLFDAFGDFMITKIYRRFAQIYALYRMEFILKEIGRRIGRSLMQVRFMLPSEVRNALLKGKLNRKEIAQRTKFCVQYAEKGREVVFTGENAETLAKKAERVHVGEVKELKGQTGCVGYSKGAVKIIIRPADMAKMKKGNILVSIATDPDIVPAMKKAAAIVTEQGGVTSHAAIVSRELGIPCVIGTKIATKVLKDGDMVEVDATKGIVRKI